MAFLLWKLSSLNIVTVMLPYVQQETFLGGKTVLVQLDSRWFTSTPDIQNCKAAGTESQFFTFSIVYLLWNQLHFHYYLNSLQWMITNSFGWEIPVFTIARLPRDPSLRAEIRTEIKRKSIYGKVAERVRQSFTICVANFNSKRVSLCWDTMSS